MMYRERIKCILKSYLKYKSDLIFTGVYGSYTNRKVCDIGNNTAIAHSPYEIYLSTFDRSHYHELDNHFLILTQDFEVPNNIQDEEL